MINTSVGGTARPATGDCPVRSRFWDPTCCVFPFRSWAAVPAPNGGPGRAIWARVRGDVCASDRTVRGPAPLCAVPTRCRWRQCANST